ncbi:hypothetical protein ABMA27_002051 [Loxostege sticticalis]|uniref:RING-type domain-containing protein n=1 Tax=Loxostege sticticalis TaxID=481309 RepID=A0ABR3HWD2_LOXSC
MSVSLNISDVIEHVKNIVDSIRCTVCDKADGGRVRFNCGHTSCDDCLIGTEGCMLCLTPPTSLGKPKPDEILSQRVQNACNLLNACQDTFNLDVYRRLRVSEQLKAEKELFPECIQAPAKYCNKRKSTTPKGNKENLYNSFHPGEHISHTDSYKMKKSNNYVKQWLEDSETFPRRALGDLIVNRQNQMSKKNTFQQTTVKSYQKNSNKTYNDRNTSNLKHRKRTLSQTSFSLIDKENSVSELNIKKSKKSKFGLPLHEDSDKNVFEHTDNEESGIVIDDEPILIEDSQSQVIDKDKLALLAVEAAEKERSDFISLALESTQDNESLPPVSLKQLNNENNKNVPFYKKTSLADCCFYCKVDNTPNSKSNSDDKNVSITIENQHFITTINISKCAEVTSDKKSVLVQTNLNDAEKPPESKENIRTDESNEMVLPYTRKTSTESLDLLQSQGINNLHEDYLVPQKGGGIVIADSDSDESCLGGSFLEVTAEVHKSCEPIDYGILSAISTSELPSRSRNKVRGITPDSNNSSDKENCDPNKMKKHKKGKKSKYSKK